MDINFFYAKHKHRMWKTRLKAFLLGLEDFDEKKITSSKDCALGKWINTEARALLEGDEILQKLIEHHEHIHTIVEDIPKLKHSNKLEEANKKYNELEKESEYLIDLLSSAEEAIQKSKNFTEI